MHLFLSVCSLSTTVSVYLSRDLVNVPVTFAFDLPTHGAAVAQRKQLLLLPLREEKQSLVTVICFITN